MRIKLLKVGIVLVRWGLIRMPMSVSDMIGLSSHMISRRSEWWLCGKLCVSCFNRKGTLIYCLMCSSCAGLWFYGLMAVEWQYKLHSTLCPFARTKHSRKCGQLRARHLKECRACVLLALIRMGGIKNYEYNARTSQQKLILWVPIRFYDSSWRIWCYI